jgi:uncharacterized protein YprB with RNaseH-like and TPR domain
VTLFFDLETIPADESVVDLVREQFERRSRSATSTRREVTLDEYLHGTSLDPNFGRILCIGYALDDQPATTIHGDRPSPTGSSGASAHAERTLLQQFWTVAAGATTLVGHNAVSFDVPFLWKRSILTGVTPTIDLTDPTLIADTMLIWDMKMPRKHTSLDLLAKLLGIPTSKSEMSGAEVYDYYRAGKLQAIYDYCQRDVEVTRAIYRKLVPSR